MRQRTDEGAEVLESVKVLRVDLLALRDVIMRHKAAREIEPDVHGTDVQEGTRHE